ncbi:MAG: group II intron reverse transcriptase domain-containing protein [Candidatus Zambryskibacteria bacterium]|nr:group II intron reverse transcriptase domain-containing protein [Candidatus Zambryskibacteria bacterium]
MYERIISLENLFDAWREFLKGKRKRKDVAEFSENLSANIYNLHLDLKSFSYLHGPYHAFNISDPKPRNIHKATVRDRLLHHAIYRVLYPYFDKAFISDSYSCRLSKGTHRALERFKRFGNRVSKNRTKQCFILKCDIRKFFASIDHQILLQILEKYISDKNILWLLERIIYSFDKGLPLGNLTSQLLVNIYMNEFDQFVKHKLKIKHYIRYADDFILFSQDKSHPLREIQNFLENNLKLTLHPNKVFTKTLSSGLDFLGWVHFPKHRVLRTVTKRRMLKKLKQNPNKESLDSYLGMLEWGNGRKLRKLIGKL